MQEEKLFRKSKILFLIKYNTTIIIVIIIKEIIPFAAGGLAKKIPHHGANSTAYYRIRGVRGQSPDKGVLTQLYIQLERRAL